MKTSTSIQSNNRTIEQSNNFRRGSALLIVLGMLSFMVISAVSFSILARQNRAPSSYLRRNIAARYLVRAALANAIADLEGNFNEDERWGGGDQNGNDLTSNRFFGIYDDPYPGCGKDNNDYSGQPEKNGDYWFKRVFCPFGPVQFMDLTVPTLTLEGLAYLPPAIVDDVRRLSRLTRTASWRALPYEAGRFAYTAVNVSDMFDINRLRAYTNRNTGANGRISLAPLCAKTAGDPMSFTSTDAEELDRWLDKVNETKIGGNKVPFVSLADFALTTWGSKYSPFSNFVGGSANSFLMETDYQTANGLFITDTWFPQTNAAPGATILVKDLADVRSQPFKDFTANDITDVGLNRMMSDDTAVKNVYTHNLGGSLIALYDYLDGDSSPISLAYPTVEAVPMVVGVSAPAPLKAEVSDSTPAEKGQFDVTGKYSDSDGNLVPYPGTVKYERNAKLQVLKFGSMSAVQVVTTFPFKHMKTSGRTGNFQLHGIMKLFVATDDMGCRPLDDDVLLRTQEAEKNPSQSQVNQGVVTITSADKTITAFNRDIQKTEDAVDDTVQLMFNLSSVELPISYLVTETPPANLPKGFVPDEGQVTPSYSTLDGLRDTALRPLNKQAEVVADWVTQRDAAKPTYDPNAAANGITKLGAISGEYRLYAAVWVQVIEDGEVVDMVPANRYDDVTWLKVNTTKAMGYAGKTGNGTPLLNFRTDVVVKFDTNVTADPSTASYKDWGALYAVDPRYNFAPEDWFTLGTTKTVAKKDDWLTELGLKTGTSSKWFGQTDNDNYGQFVRDRDIFMFVSDQEYLQSIGELQFIPYLQRLGQNVSSFLSGDYAPDFGTYEGRPFSERDAADPAKPFLNGKRFWRTYSAYECSNAVDPDQIYALRDGGNTFCFESGAGGFRVNPYSDDDRVTLAAIAGTPYDYYVTSTNVMINDTVKNMRPSDCEKYSFGESGLTPAKMDKTTIQNISDKIHDAFADAAAAGDADWLSVWDDPDLLAWQKSDSSKIGDSNDEFLGISISSADKILHGVDRKFLYSFWRECFANRQQLFLIFVRAEPAAMGGGGSGSLTSAQLGGRAVALVWRDPSAPIYAGTPRKPRNQLRNNRNTFRDNKRECPPHQTRILFYHQFD